MSHIGDFYVCFTEVAPSLSSGSHVAVKRCYAVLPDPTRRCSGSVSGSPSPRVGSLHGHMPVTVAAPGPLAA